MSSEEELESFEVTDNDLKDAFYPGFRRKFTKEQAIYGMWANDEDRAGSSKRTKKGDYTTPMDFVSGGFTQKQDDESDNSSIDEDKDLISDEDDDSNLPDNFSTSKAAKKEQRKQEPAKQKRKPQSTKQVSSKFGAWTKHTKGFGQKLMEKMGYVHGKGLGKKGEGIIEPVQAFKRSGRGAIGAYGSERPGATDLPSPDSEEEVEKTIKQEIKQLGQWKKSGQDSNKPKYVYKTADEVKASGPLKKKFAGLTGYKDVKVVDMTGPETKILSGYSSIGQQHAKPEEVGSHPVLSTEPEQQKAFTIPELEYNLKLLLDLSESDIVQIDRQLHHERDLVVNLEHESERLEKIIKEEESEINRLNSVTTILDRCKMGLQHNVDEPLSLKGLVELFQMLQDKYYEEYKMYSLDNLIVPLGFPLFQKHFETWRPLSEQHFGLDVVRLWKEVLEEKQPVGYSRDQQGQKSMNPFEKIIWDVCMPYIRTAISQWNPRDSDPLIMLLEVWAPVLPDWVTSNILDQLVLPRLQVEVDIWNPLIDTMPIHTWIHPWLPLMGSRLEPVFPPIRQKLSSALTNWHPSDPSAKLILQPWAKVFSKGTMEAFLLRSIYPKLLSCMESFTVNPHQQHLEPFHWVMSWKDLLSVQHIVSILEKQFFPKWLNVLRQWLCNEPNYEEITKWYLGWKSMFSEDLLSHSTIKEIFNRALTLMNQAVSGTLQPGAKENIAYLTSTERRKYTETSPQEQVSTPSGFPSNFKDLIEKAAEENNILFMPMPNKRFEGKAIYSFGKSMVYLDRNVIFTSFQGQWRPTSLQDLINTSR
ncbi:tuftelin-interacting protein 11-like [Rhopilema esculentum]|uniref:tuftelin-interacting protein 11-like n=1 Tax=Rhopilema esculentum TaxID=499914 RepID=UPI0031D8C4D9|eukprot:gene14644-5731_t